MPGVVVHLVVARRILERWRVAPDDPPFDPDDPEVCNAFRHGALGPDLGYFPGGHRPLSDLAHCVRTGALTRALLDGARTDVERAFAWGWLSHVLADTDIHPWIGRGVGAALRGSPDFFVDGATDPCTHLRVEMGVDGWFAACHPWARRVRLRRVFRPGGVELLVDAYRRTYGVELPEDAFLRSHRAVCLRVHQMLPTLGIVHALRDGGPVERRVPFVARAIRRGLECPRFRRVSLAYLAPLSPSPWLLEAITGEVDRQAERFLDQFRRGARDLEDNNLDTGRLIRRHPDHPGTRRALLGLEDLLRQTRGRRIASVGDPLPTMPAFSEV